MERLNISSEEIGVHVCGEMYFDDWIAGLENPINIVSIKSKTVIGSSSHASPKTVLTIIFTK